MQTDQETVRLLCVYTVCPDMSVWILRIIIDAIGTNGMYSLQVGAVEFHPAPSFPQYLLLVPCIVNPSPQL